MYNFFSLQHQNLEMAIFLCRELRAGKECETEKKPTIFAVIPYIYNGETIRSRFRRPQPAATNIPYALNVGNSTSKLYFTLITLTVYDSTELQEGVFTPAVSSSCFLFCQNYVASIHFGVA